MTRTWPGLLGLLLIIAAALAWSSLFIVHQTEQVLVLQFGDPKRVLRDPGLKVKIPFVQNVVYYDRRVLDYDPPAEEIIASDQKRLVVDAYTRFKIIDPLHFYQTVRDENGVRNRLGALVSASLRRVVGNVTLASILSAERADIMLQIRDQVNVEAKSFGIEVVDVRIRRADLPEENNQAIYARMQSEREREAREFRAQGAELAQRIRSRADREKVVILAEAQKQAQITRGDGDSQSIRIYAQAYNQDPDFYAFYRSLAAYRDALESGTTFVLSPQSEFLRFLNQPAGMPLEGTR
ncbi:MAG: protease modulator HflC [Alphaproteobacteria bacterium]